jgi:CRISPR/Cas system-associated exonuclease Cas4 (RecB family)
MLTRATYPIVWAGHGYPERPSTPAIEGTVIHNVLERILRAVHTQGCTSLADACAVEVMRSLGGYSTLIQTEITSQLAAFDDNPRAGPLVDVTRTGLLARTPEMRLKLQALLARTRFQAGDGHQDAARDKEPVRRGPIAEGAYPEIELCATDLRCRGRADLLTVADGGCSITDYKTGKPKPSHAEQIQLYALLWSRDRTVNPDGLPVNRLNLAYATHDEQVEVPTAPVLADMAQAVAERITRAEGECELRPPPAKPSVDICPYCAVRHLCDEYWAAAESQRPDDAAEGATSYGDAEVELLHARGSRSWEVKLVAHDDVALLRTTDEVSDLREGDRVRLVGVAFARDADSGVMTLTMTRFSESFIVNPSP